MSDSTSWTFFKFLRFRDSVSLQQDLAFAAVSGLCARWFICVISLNLPRSPIPAAACHFGLLGKLRLGDVIMRLRSHCVPPKPASLVALPSPSPLLHYPGNTHEHLLCTQL